MRFTFQYDENENILRASFNGEITLEVLMDYVNQVIAKTELRKGFIEIVDLNEVENLVIGYLETEKFPDLWKQYQDKGSLGTVVIAPTDLAFGIVTMLKTVIGIYNDFTDRKFIIIRSKDELEKAVQRLGK